MAKQTHDFLPVLLLLHTNAPILANQPLDIPHC